MKHPKPWLGLVLAASLGMGTLLHKAAEAVQFPDGTVHFTHPPRLVKAVATRFVAFDINPTYYFTLTIPEDANEPLQRITISQQKGEISDQRVDYRLEQSRAFEGTFRRRGPTLPLGEVSYDAETRTASINFDPPVLLPGKTFSVGLKVVRNPFLGGVYLYGVTAYPEGEVSSGQFIGFGRITIFDGGSR
ncbi:MAG: DUF2808 domain-containing protein [Cyanothece sp. SIO1E1]|nr:DUF2808 domain-containing protein [Cyanothece sp. SIO1E1]